MIRKTLHEKLLFNLFSSISEKVILDDDLYVSNFVTPKQKLLQTRVGKFNRTSYNLRFFKNDLNELNVYLTVFRKNRITGYYFGNISFNDDYLDLNDFILTSCVVGNGHNCLLLKRQL